MEVKCQDCGLAIEPTSKVAGQAASWSLVPREIYLTQSRTIAWEISTKLKSCSDITQTLLNSEKEQTKRSRDKIEEFVLSGDNNYLSFWNSWYKKLLLTFEESAKGLENERDKYLAKLKEIEYEINSFDQEKVDETIKDLTKKKDTLMEELNALNEEEQKLDMEAEELVKREEQLAEQERKYWEEENDYEYKLKSYLEETAQMKNQWKYIERHYKYLKKLNVLNDVFNIEIDGEFGKISGFRLGTLGTKGNIVEADEINAAWGQIVLLISAIALKAEYTFANIEFKPLGNHSKIIKVKDNNRKASYAFDFKDTGAFNNAMIILLEAVSMLCFHFKKKYEHLKERVKLDSFLQMDNEKIDDERISFDNERLEEWTNAWKNLLQVILLIKSNLIFYSELKMANINDSSRRHY